MFKHTNPDSLSLKKLKKLVAFLHYGVNAKYLLGFLFVCDKN
jgi:hypothetical protein